MRFRVLPHVQLLASYRIRHFFNLRYVYASDLEQLNLKTEMRRRNDSQAIIIFPFSDESPVFNSPRIALPIEPAFTIKATVDNGPRRDSMRFEWHV